MSKIFVLSTLDLNCISVGPKLWLLGSPQAKTPKYSYLLPYNWPKYAKKLIVNACEILPYSTKDFNFISLQPKLLVLGWSQALCPKKANFGHKIGRIGQNWPISWCVRGIILLHLGFQFHKPTTKIKDARLPTRLGHRRRRRRRRRRGCRGEIADTKKSEYILNITPTGGDIILSCMKGYCSFC